MDHQNIISLSRREKQVLQLIGTGLNSREIAGKLDLTIDTISSHRRSILGKTGAKNMIVLLIHAVQQRVIDIESLAA